MSFVFITVAAWAPVDSNLALSVVAAPGHDDGSAAEHGCDRLVSLENGELDAIGTQMQRMVQSLFRGRWTRLCVADRHGQQQLADQAREARQMRLVGRR